MKYIITEEQNISLRRRLSQLNNLFNVVLNGMNPCDYSNESHFFDGVIYDLETYLSVMNINELQPDEIIDYVKEHMKDDIFRYYIDSQEDC
jgi:hypothetical protein